MQVVKNKESVFILLKNNAEKIRACGIDKIGLFGSFVRDINIRKDSDIDFLLDFKKGQKNLHNLVVLGDLLEELLGRKVELITRESLRSEIGLTILKSVENVPL